MRPSVVRCKSRALKSPPPPDAFITVAAEFPSIEIASCATEPELQAEVWRRDDFDFWRFDRSLDNRQDQAFSLTIGGEPAALPAVAGEVLTRCQRLVRRTNPASDSSLFRRVLDRHGAMHDLSKPLVRADYDHSIDVWQWLLRLQPDAPLAVQLAALFHDIERLASEADRRIEHMAPDYETFKNRHARQGSSVAAAVLGEAGAPEDLIGEVVVLIDQHESGRGILTDADALSFFSMNSSGFFNHYPPDHCRRKVAYTLRRLDPAHRHYLRQMRLTREVASAVEEELKGMA
jgi:hypothetical protein